MKTRPLALLLLCAGCSHPDYRGSIQQVLDGRRELRDQIMHAPVNKIEWMEVADMTRHTLIFNVQDYALVLRSISLKDCPQDFCQAWNGYLSAWNYRAHEFASPVYLLPARPAMLNGDFIETYVGVGSSADEGERRTQSAWQKLQAVSVKYGARTE